MVRATHVEAPALDGAERYPDLYGETTTEDEKRASSPSPRTRAGAAPEPEPAAAPRLEPATEPALTPMGNRRSAVTESDEHRLPHAGPAFLKRSSGAQKVDTKGIERIGDPAGGGAQPLQRRGAGDRARSPDRT